jgi:hypothetical protein
VGKEHLENARSATFTSMKDPVSFTPPPRRRPLIGRMISRTRRQVQVRVHTMFTSRGPGFKRLAQAHAGSVAGDTLVAMALAGTLFFDVPSTDARDRVALYLLITLAPFTVIGPFLGTVYDRFPGAYRGGLVVSAASRSAVAVAMALFVDNLLLLYPLAFVMLVFSRLMGISRSSLLPIVLAGPSDLIAANAQIARIGVLASAVVAPVGVLGIWIFDSWLALLFAAAVFVWSAFMAGGLPSLDTRSVVAAARAAGDAYDKREKAAPQPVRLARFATAGVRFLNGFLLLHVAFAFRDADAGILDFGALLVSAGLGFFLAALATPVLDRYISEEPMVVAGLAVEAGAAFIAAQAFNLGAAAFLSAAAGFAWGTAKFGFDGLLQATMPANARGRAFTNSETFFQSAWVVGSLIAILPGSGVGFLSIPSLPVEVGLIVAGLLSLSVQVVYVSAVLVPVVAARRSEQVERGTPSPRDDGDVMDLLG